MFLQLSPENWLITIAFLITALYSNWLIIEAEKQNRDSQ